MPDSTAEDLARIRAAARADIESAIAQAYAAAKSAAAQDSNDVKATEENSSVDDT